MMITIDTDLLRKLFQGLEDGTIPMEELRKLVAGVPVSSELLPLPPPPNPILFRFLQSTEVAPGWTVRAYNGLRAMGVEYLGELALATEKAMLRVNNIGWKTAREYSEMLTKNGLSFEFRLDRASANWLVQAIRRLYESGVTTPHQKKRLELMIIQVNRCVELDSHQILLEHSKSGSPFEEWR